MTSPHDIVVAPPGAGVPVRSADPEPTATPFSMVLLSRWRFLLLASMTIAIASVALIRIYVVPKFEVSALVHVAPVVRPILFSDAESDISRHYHSYLATEAHAIVSPAVIVETLNTSQIRSLPMITRTSNPAQFLSSRLSAKPMHGEQFLRVSMIGHHAEEMALIVNSLLEAYLRQRKDKQRAWDELILSSLRAEQVALETRLKAKDLEMRQLGSQNGGAVLDDSGSALQNWIVELRQKLIQMRQDGAIAFARHDALNANENPANLQDFAAKGFLTYVESDAEWHDTSERLRMMQAAALEDERLGRGPMHPDVQGRSDRIAMYKTALDLRTSELGTAFKKKLRREFTSAQLEATVSEKVLTDAVEELMVQQSDVMRQAFAMESVRHERERLENSLTQVRQKTWNVQVEQHRSARITIDSPAVAPAEPNIDKRMKYSMAACAMSLFLGAGFVLVRHRLDTSVVKPTEVTNDLGLQYLGCIQYIQSSNGTTVANDHRLQEPIRSISTALLSSSHSGSSRIRLVTSPTAGSGKSSLALGLARSLASTGRRVLLVDADITGRGVTQALDMPAHRGLSEFLRGTAGAAESVQSGHAENLDVMPAGEPTGQFGAHLANLRAQANLRTLFQDYDEVILDSPPVLVGSHAVVLATLADEIVLVIRAGKTTREEARASCRTLSTIGEKPVRVILNAVERRHAPYAYYGYANANAHGPAAQGA